MVRRFERLKLSLMLRAVGIYKHLTLGARVVVICEESVLVVRHTYSAGWQFPGGGVDPGETLEQAGRRELREETGYAATGAMRLFGVYHSDLFTNRDHVGLFVTDSVEKVRVFSPNREIAEIAWVPLDAVPDDLSPATARRLAEIVDGLTPDAKW